MAKWLSAGVLTLVAILIIAIYLPFVQDFIFSKVLDRINSDNMHISATEIRLSFPVRLNIKNLSVKQHNDTAVFVEQTGININPLGLLIGKVSVSSIRINNGRYSMGNQDSIMMLRARISQLSASADINLNPLKIDLDKTDADGIKIKLGIKRDTVPAEKTDTATKSNMIVHARSINLRKLDFSMDMEGNIDSLGTKAAFISLTEGEVDLGHQTVYAEKLAVDSLSASYIVPLITKGTPENNESDSTAVSEPSVPWTIRAGTIEINSSDALYATAGAVPEPGLDLNYIKAEGINIRVDSFHNRGSEIRVPVVNLHAKEKSGLELNLSGIFSIGQKTMCAENMKVSTGFSNISFNAYMNNGNLTDSPTAPLGVNLDAEISPEDIRLCYPELSGILRSLPRTTLLNTKIGAKGSLEQLSVDQLDIALTGIASINANGELRNIADLKKLSGNINIKGRIRDGKRIKSSLTAAKLGENISVPNLRLNGNLKINSGNYTSRIKAFTDSGTIALDGSLDMNAERYDASIKADRFPVCAFLPNLGFDRITTEINATGTNFNPIETGAELFAHIGIESAIYRNKEYKDINLIANISEGKLDANINSPNKYAKFSISATGNISPDPMNIVVDADIENLDLYSLGLMQDDSHLNTKFNATATIDTKKMFIDADADISVLKAKLDSATNISANDILISFKSDSATSASISNGDLKVRFFSPENLDSVTAKFSNAADSITRYYNSRSANFSALRNTLPIFSISADAGSKNILGSYLSSKKMSLKQLSLKTGNDSVMNLSGSIIRFTSGTTRLDTIRLDIRQIEHYITFDARLDNTPGNLDKFAHVEANGYIVNSKAGLFIRQSDIKRNIGYRLGATAEIEDSLVRISLVPYNPIIGYKKWSVNRDNFISIDLAEKHLDANLHMKSDESSIRLYTEHIDSIHHQEDINLKVSNIKLDEWLSLNPFSPQIKGDLNADIRLSADHGQITGTGIVGLNEFFYGGKRVGSFDLDVSVTAAQGRKLRADVTLMVDSIKTITAYGHLNDSTSENPFLLDFKMIHFPLNVVNPFLPPGTGSLDGTLNGQMDITGELANPIFNGFIDFENTSFHIDMLGSSLKFSDTKIPVDSNIVSFDNFAITAANKNPLLINGAVDFRSISDSKLDLALKARNMQLVNTSRAPKKADVYGKAFIDLDADVIGRLTDLHIDADMRLLAGTNVTYIVPDATNTLQSKSNSEMVRFISFEDSTALAVTDTVPSRNSDIDIDALLTIEEGTYINVDLAAGSSNKIAIQPSGTLDFSMSSLIPATLIGRINIDGGYVSYTPPFMSAKKFVFEEDSYISFTGDMMNPMLNIHAVDNLKANITQSGQDSRLVTFDIMLGITGSLNRMDVGFDLSTKDDITIQNELASMSAEQRANQAMNLLLYNVYTGPGTKGNANIGGNALYSFLESQVNSWAANNIRGVDISFGIDQYDQTTNGATTKTTSYSYRLSKSLFNDRFKIVIGGAYTDDDNPNQNVALELINDISLEYSINKNGTMVIKIFRHTGYESILEGEITQTGIGFVYKRKIDNLRDIFRSSRNKRQALLPVPRNIKANN